MSEAKKVFEALRRNDQLHKELDEYEKSISLLKRMRSAKLGTMGGGATADLRALYYEHHREFHDYLMSMGTGSQEPYKSQYIRMYSADIDDPDVMSEFVLWNTCIRRVSA